MRVKDIFRILCFGRWFLEFRCYVTDVATLYGKEVNECNGGVQMFHKSGFHLKILDAKKMTRRKFHPEDPQLLSAIVHN